jgi:hypothetical protein
MPQLLPKNIASWITALPEHLLKIAKKHKQAAQALIMSAIQQLS